MQENITSESLFCDYYAQWVRTYKEGAIRDVTMGKYRLTQSWLSKLIPELRLADMDRTAYQQLINGYAQHHERQTTMDFHHQIKGAILDAVDEGLIPRDPTRKVIIKGKQPRIKKMKYLNQFELHAMLADLDLGDEASWDWLILLIAKTGLRFSEALGLTPDDFDFAHQTLSVSKTWDYKNRGGFVPTKNESSVRKVQLDWQLIMQLSGLLKNLPHDKPIFVHGKVYNSTANDVLARHCKNVDVPYTRIAAAVRRRINRQRVAPPRPRQHDHNTGNLSACHSRIGKQGRGHRHASAVDAYLTRCCFARYRWTARRSFNRKAARKRNPLEKPVLPAGLHLANQCTAHVTGRWTSRA